MTQPEGDSIVPGDNWWINDRERADDGLTAEVLGNAYVVFQDLATNSHRLRPEHRPDVALLRDQVGSMYFQIDDAPFHQLSQAELTARHYRDALAAFDYLKEYGTQDLDTSIPIEQCVSEFVLKGVERELTERYVKRERIERAAEIEGLVDQHSGAVGRALAWPSLRESTDMSDTRSLHVPRYSARADRLLGQDTVYRRGNYGLVSVSKGKTVLLHGNVGSVFVENPGTALVVLGSVRNAMLGQSSNLEVVGSLGSVILGKGTRTRVIGDVSTDMVNSANYSGGELTIHGKIGGVYSRRTFNQKPQLS